MVKEIKQHAAAQLVDLLRNSWFLIVFVGTAVYWVAKQDTSAGTIQKSDARITALESRVSSLESGLGQMQVKLDNIREDIALIKTAVIK